MSREEAMKAFIESGMELRRDDIELGRKLERERIIELMRQRYALAVNGKPHWIAAMGIKVDKRSALLITEALIYAIQLDALEQEEGEQK